MRRKLSLEDKIYEIWVVIRRIFFFENLATNLWNFWENFRQFQREFLTNSWKNSRDKFLKDSDVFSWNLYKIIQFNKFSRKQFKCHNLNFIPVHNNSSH